LVKTSPFESAARAAAETAIELRGVSADYGGVVVLSRVSLSLAAGSVSAVVGPAGAGKSTLLRCMLGGLTPRAGDVRVLGQPATQARGLVSYLPQGELVDWRFPLSLAEIVMMGRYRALGLLGRPGAREHALVSACLRQVGLDRLADRPLSELTPGQRARALLARALAQERDVLLLDEPFLGIELGAENHLFDLIERLSQQGRTIVVATRELAGVAQRFAHLVLLNSEVVAEGPPPEVLTQRNLQAAYGSQLVTLRVSAEHFAVDAGPR
jgi:manganese/zinc/iron transport system ATP- binding protein